jgi:ABC-type uncharacterized transport system YnjBCD permease subunit
MVRREPGRLIIVEPPTGMWMQMRAMIFGVLIYLAVCAAGVALIVRWFLPVPPRVATLWVVIRIWLNKGDLPWQMLAATAFVLLMAYLIGRITRTIIVETDRIVVEMYFGWPWKHPLERTFARAEISRITVSLIGSGIVAHMGKGKKPLVVLGRRADAKWLTRVLRGELGLAHDSASMNGQP